MPLSDWIGELPSEFQPWAIRWTPVLLNWTKIAFDDWVAKIKAGLVLAAREQLAESMTVQQAVDDLLETNEDLAGANQEQKDRNNLGWLMLTEFLRIVGGFGFAVVGL